VFSLSGADLAIEAQAGAVLRDAPGQRRGLIVSVVLYAAGLIVLAAAAIDRRRRNVDPVLAARRTNVRRQQAKIVQAAGLPAPQAAREIAAAVRALVADQPEVAREAAEAVIAACESVVYAPTNGNDNRLDAALVERAVAVADHFARCV
jgi:hypothetical protein